MAETGEHHVKWSKPDSQGQRSQVFPHIHVCIYVYIHMCVYICTQIILYSYIYIYM
jgi:hypothetical protein